MIEEEIKKSYRRLVEECIEKEAFFKDRKTDRCMLAEKVNDIYLIQCPYLLKCNCHYKKN
ncbi:MAG: hypothetical protein QXK80_01140 [Candidatus Pacearchaeota archaeon]